MNMSEKGRNPFTAIIFVNDTIQKSKIKFELVCIIIFQSQTNSTRKSIHLKTLDAKSLRVKSGLNKKELLANKAFETELEYYENKFAMEGKIG